MATNITNTSITTDDLTVDTNVLKVDSANNRVGIGTATPTQATLHVAGGGVPARFESTSASTAYVQFGASATTNYGQIAMTGNDMTLRTAYQDRMTIDSNGYVSMPNQPAFMAFKSGNFNVSNSVVQVTGWNNNLDIGGHWDNSQNRYTVPTAGIYLAGGFYQANQSTGLHFAIFKNGAAYGNDSLLDMVSGGANGYSVPFQMAANDYFTWVAYTSSASAINQNRSKIWVIKVA